MRNETEKEILSTALQYRVHITPNALKILLKQESPLNILKEIIEKNKNTFAITPELLTSENTTIPQETPSLKNQTNIKITQNYTESPKTTDVSSISGYFNVRYNYFRKQLQPRLSNTVSIANARQNGKKASLIGLVNSKHSTQTGNFILELEDPTGNIKAIATKKETILKLEGVVLDEVIGISGTISNSFFFIDDVTWPDLPMKREESKLKEDVCAAFLSDTHIGSRKFLSNDFKEMLKWLKGMGAFSNNSIHSEISEKIKYLFVAGDIVDGIGVYPFQQDELEIKEIHRQYEYAARLFSEIPERIQIVMCPGNHDYVRTAQPQPPLDKEIAKELYELPNISIVSNPAIATISNGISELNILLYHGVSIDEMVSSDPALKDGYKHPEKVMCSLLKKRHLSPQYETGLVTSTSADFMTIPENIDIFHSGHVHANGAMSYRGVTLINSGTWQEQTEFQRLCGHEPTPGKMPVLNLKSRELHLIEFIK